VFDVRQFVFGKFVAAYIVVCLLYMWTMAQFVSVLCLICIRIISDLSPY
jgi:hypothetical protein